MERLKGMLKRKSRGESMSSDPVNDIPYFSSMEITTTTTTTTSPDIESDSNEVLNGSLPHRARLSDSDSGHGDDSGTNNNTHALMMDKIEQLTNEKYSLEDTLSDIKSRMERIEEENLNLKSRCDDLQTSLELEKRRFRWQQKFYEKRIQQLAGLPDNSTSVMEPESESEPRSEQSESAEPVPTTSSNNEDIKKLRKAQSIEDLLECNAFYENTIKSLVTVQETKSKELNDLKNFYEAQLNELSLKYEADISEILESSDIQVQKIIAENEGLIRDLLTGCEGLFDELKVEYTTQVRDNGELETRSGQNILDQFKGLSTPVKGIVVAGIAVISVATAGWASWGFIIWVWPRLLVFAEVLAANPETSLMYLVGFLNSVPFQSFLKSWEEGKPLTECLKSFANTEFLTSALRMAPDLFSQFKTFHGRRLRQTI